MINEIIQRLLEEKSIVENLPTNCDEDGFGDGESLYEDGVIDGRYQGIVKALEIIEIVQNEIN